MSWKVSAKTLDDEDVTVTSMQTGTHQSVMLRDASVLRLRFSSAMSNVLEMVRTTKKTSSSVSERRLQCRRLFWVVFASKRLALNLVERIWEALHNKTSK